MKVQISVFHLLFSSFILSSTCFPGGLFMANAQDETGYFGTTNPNVIQEGRPTPTPKPRREPETYVTPAPDPASSLNPDLNVTPIIPDSNPEPSPSTSFETAKNEPSKPKPNKPWHRPRRPSSSSSSSTGADTTSSTSNSSGNSEPKPTLTVVMKVKDKMDNGLLLVKNPSGFPVTSTMVQPGTNYPTVREVQIFLVRDPEQDVIIAGDEVRCFACPDGVYEGGDVSCPKYKWVSGPKNLTKTHWRPSGTLLDHN